MLTPAWRRPLRIRINGRSLMKLGKLAEALGDKAARRLRETFFVEAGDRMKNVLMCACLATACSLSYANVINTNNPADVAAFQSGATVVNFESISGVTPQAITNYNSGVAVSSTAFVFNQISGVQFSVGGAPGTNEPAMYQLNETIAGGAHSSSTV